MRNVIASEYLSLDGVMEEPRWTMPYWSDDLAHVARNQLFAADALLVGRLTYEGFAQAWPNAADEEGFADRMNGLPKYVATSSLEPPAWNNSRRIEGNVTREVARLKEEPGGDLLIYGSGELVRTLLQAGLIDELRLWVHPVVVGQGKRLFGEGEPTNLRLVNTQSFPTGVVILTYAPDRA